MACPQVSVSLTASGQVAVDWWIPNLPFVYFWDGYNFTLNIGRAFFQNIWKVMQQLCFKTRNGSSQWNSIIQIETNQFHGNRNHMKSNSVYHHKISLMHALLYNFTLFRMPRYAQLVVGPAGSGKSTYCKLMQDHFAVIKRQCMGESYNMSQILIRRDIGSAFSWDHKYFSKSVSDFFKWYP